MAKIVLITDTHAGMRNDNKALRNKQQAFFDEVFFPYIDDHNIRHVVHLGDVFDRRKFVNFETLAWWNYTFMSRLDSRNIKAHFIAGNHDVYYRSNNDVNSLKELYTDTYKNMSFYWQNTVELTFDGCKVLLCPWLSPANSEQCLAEIEASSAQVLMGHFEIAGYQMQRGQLCDHGLDSNIFSKFHSVLSGHFHSKSVGRNITYLGAPYQMTWADYGEKKGFHVFDTETLELEFIENPHNSFIKLKYEDSDLSFDDVANFDVSNLKDTFIKIVLVNKTNGFIFDRFVDRINSGGPADVKIVDDNKYLDNLDIETFVDETQSTDQILRTFVESLEVAVDKDKLHSFIQTLYQESLAIA